MSWRERWTLFAVFVLCFYLIFGVGIVGWYYSGIVALALALILLVQGRD